MASDETSTLGERIKTIRKLLELKQKEFAEGLDISVQSLSDIENGKTKPCHDFFFNMGNRFHVDLYYLFYGVGHPFNKKGDSDGNQEISTADMFSQYKENFSDEDVREFLTILAGSRVIRYEMLGLFERLKYSDDAFIKRDFERLLKK
jgi:transcriptional regulator with XRE-family HTH domain